MPKTFITLTSNEGKIVIRASAINLIQAPSRLSTQPTGLIIIANQPMTYPTEVCNTVIEMLDELDKDHQQNLNDLTGKGPSRN